MISEDIKKYEQWPITVVELIYDNLPTEWKIKSWIWNNNCRAYTHYCNSYEEAIELASIIRKVIKEVLVK